MGPGLVFLILIIMVGAFGFLWIGSLVIFIVGRKKGSVRIKWFGLVPLTILTILALFLGSLIVVGIVNSMNPHYVFTKTFAEEPDEHVHELKSKVWTFADSSDIYLQFKTSPDKFHRLMPTDLKRVTFEEYKADLGYLDDWPDWWQAIDRSNSEIFVLNKSHGEGKKYESELTLMIYDAKSQFAQYYFCGID
jgi:hypothetical protein